jgi:autotransporter translocation and assembly factor TamB
MRRQRLYTVSVVRRKRWLLGVGAAVVLTLVGLVMALHHPTVQQRLWSRAQRALSVAGIDVEADRVQAWLLAPRLEVTALRIRIEERTVLTAERIEVRFRWHRVLSAPRHLDLIEIAGLWVDPAELASSLPSAEATDDSVPAPIPWRAVEVGRLEIVDARVGSDMTDLAFRVADLSFR